VVGRAWIPVLGVLLVGIVAVQVEVLKLGASIGRSVNLATELQSTNQLLRSNVAKLGDDQRIERLAARMGMIMPGPTEIRFVSAGAPGALNKAISTMQPAAPGTFLTALQTEETTDGTLPSSSGAGGASSTDTSAAAGATAATSDAAAAATTAGLTTPTDGTTSTTPAPTIDGGASGATAPSTDTTTPADAGATSSVNSATGTDTPSTDSPATAATGAGAATSIPVTTGAPTTDASSTGGAAPPATN
jgi:cytoskeletal protein RodZ